MIITLKGCTATAFIGGLNFFKVSRGTVSGADVTISTSTINKDEATSTSARQIATVALKSNYENLVVIVTMGGTTVNWFANGKVTIPANTAVTGDIKISASATAIQVTPPSGGDTPTQPTTYTFTINPTPADATVTLTASGYSQSGNSITVPSGTSVIWKVSASGYTQQTGTHTVTKTESKSVTLSENSSAPVSGTLFDFDFTTKTVEDYVNSGVITLPEGSVTDQVIYSEKGLSTGSTSLPAAITKGLKLNQPFELSSQSWTFEVIMTMDTYNSETMGTSVTEALYPNLAFFSSDEHDVLEDGKAHGSNCLAPAIYMNGGKFSGRFPDNGGVTTGSSTKVFTDDSLEHTYKWVYDKDTNTNTIFVDGVQTWSAQWTRTDYLFGGTIQYVLGVHNGYSSGKNFCIKKGMHIKNMKMYTN